MEIIELITDIVLLVCLYVMYRLNTKVLEANRSAIELNRDLIKYKGQLIIENMALRNQLLNLGVEPKKGTKIDG